MKRPAFGGPFHTPREVRFRVEASWNRLAVCAAMPPTIPVTGQSSSPFARRQEPLTSAFRLKILGAGTRTPLDAALDLCDLARVGRRESCHLDALRKPELIADCDLASSMRFDDFERELTTLTILVLVRAEFLRHLSPPLSMLNYLVDCRVTLVRIRWRRAQRFGVNHQDPYVCFHARRSICQCRNQAAYLNGDAKEPFEHEKNNGNEAPPRNDAMQEGP